MSEVSELQAKVAQLEAERDEWRNKAESKTIFPATHWPSTKPSLEAHAAYPEYDRSKPKESFVTICDMLIEECLNELKGGYECPDKELQYVRKMLEYNVKGGKMNRGIMVVESGIMILESKGREVTNDVIVQLAILGWCIEWLQAWMLVADDMMDSSQTRRDQPCWYLLPEVKTTAINDSHMINTLIYKVLKNHFSDESYYPQITDIFQETTFQTEVGQLLDTIGANYPNEEFTPERWEQIVKYKTAFYSFYCSVACGMIIAGITDVEEYDAVRKILIVMGVYFQAQDDFLDVYATPEVLGKIGTDIADRKCSWLFAHAFHEIADDEQKQYFQNHYGKVQPQSDGEEEIRQLFTKMGMKEKYEKYEQDSYDKIMTLKDTVKEVPWGVLEAFLGKIYKRSK